MAGLKKDTAYPDLKTEEAKCRDFIQNFMDEDGNNKYMDMLQEVANYKRKSIDLELDDVEKYTEDASFLQRIIKMAKRYQILFSQACDSLLPEANEPIDDIPPYHIWLAQRQARLEEMRDQDTEPESPFPIELMRRFELHLVSRSSDKINNLREVKAEHVGSLVQIRGIITKVSDVQPQILVSAYICGTCGYESYQTVATNQYTPLHTCPSDLCQKNQAQGKLHEQVRGSRFVKYQTVKLQEMPGEVPIGHVPRAMDVRLYGEMTRMVKPGDMVTLNGIFLPSLYTGFRAIKAGLLTSVYLEPQKIKMAKKTYVDMELTPEVLEEIEEKAEDKDIFDNLAASIAPEIHGMLDIKKAIMLLLVGGVTRTMPDMKIRGDINILLMGDPGVAKSQLLKYVSRVAPRGIYTTGKGASGVGLTAAVMRDPITDEMTLEGGALVLADMGICCIDEFDKMEEGDRTSIHEVMEQQTVSIAKAGITTQLNARTAILAAANPLFGRYNPDWTPEKNINLPASLLSRFDLVFLMLDKPDEEKDRNLAEHITYVHMEGKAPQMEFDPFAPGFLRQYISRARQFDPFVPKNLSNFIVQSYVGLRMEDQEDPQEKLKGDNPRERFCTARKLLSILRMAQALARIHLRDRVVKSDVQEAMRMLHVSKQLAGAEKKTQRRRPVVTAFEIISKYARQHGTTVKLADLTAQLKTQGISDAVLNETLDEFQNLGIWKVSRGRQEVRFLGER